MLDDDASALLGRWTIPRGCESSYSDHRTVKSNTAIAKKKLTLRTDQRRVISVRVR